MQPFQQVVHNNVNIVQNIQNNTYIFNVVLPQVPPVVECTEKHDMQKVNYLHSLTARHLNHPKKDEVIDDESTADTPNTKKIKHTHKYVTGIIDAGQYALHCFSFGSD